MYQTKGLIVMKTLYLMKHGQTLFNLLHKIQGWCDALLTRLGIEQAKIVEKYFKEQNIIFDYAYFSTFKRACDTLEIVTDHKMPYMQIKGLKEFNFGVFEGKDAFKQYVKIKKIEKFYNCCILKLKYENGIFNFNKNKVK